MSNQKNLPAANSEVLSRITRHSSLKLGILSDTHGFLDPRVEKIFKGVDHILHAGDIGDPMIELELKSIAPITTVLGNTDLGLNYKETEVVTLAEKKILIHHIVNPHEPSENLAAQIKKHKPDAVIFGHTHKRYAETVDGIFYFNPGYSGKPKLGTERSVALLHIEADGFRPEFIAL